MDSKAPLWSKKESDLKGCGLILEVATRKRDSGSNSEAVRNERIPKSKHALGTDGIASVDTE